MTAMANTTPLVKTVAKPATNPRDADVTPRVNIQELCEEYYEDILPIIIDKWVRELHPSSSQLTIPVYLEVRDPLDPWACKEEILLADAIAANVCRAEKKKKYRVVCRTHGVSSAHHAQSDGVLVSVPTVVPQGLAILLADAATQTETSDEAPPQLLRSSSLPVIHS
nr:hypothetical protein [Tanacetum cinerariifolium]